MKKSKRSIVILVVVIVIAGGVAFWVLNKNNESAPEPVVATQTDTSKDNIDKTTAVVLKEDSFSTFYKSIESAGLISILEGTEPYTVFAPNDKAFEALPDGTLERLQAPESSEQLKGILSYHIVQGSILSADLVTGKRLPTVNGQELTVEASEGDIYLIDAKGTKSHVIKADITTSNGVVYEIDVVLLPQ